MKAFRIVIKGVVQGVGFRYFARMRANRLNICGWVRNCPDGSVEIHCEGEESNLQKFIEEIRKGPAGVIVNSFEVVEADADFYYGFEIRS